MHGIETVVLRYFNIIFWPRQHPAYQYWVVIPLFIAKATAGVEPTMDGDGDQTRHFTFVETAVGPKLTACVADAADVMGEVFNVGAGERVSINELWRFVR